MLPGCNLKCELGNKNSKILSNQRLCGSIRGSVTSKNLRNPAVFSPFLLTSPRRLPHFRSLSSVRQLSYWHSHHLLRTRWISFLQKSFAPRHSQGCSHLPGHFPSSPFSSLFSSHTRSFPPISTSPRTRCLQSTSSVRAVVDSSACFRLQFICQSNLLVHGTIT